MSRVRVDGRRMQHHVGEQITVLGTITTTSNDGMSFELNTTDGVAINVSLSEPFTDNVEGYVEVHGVAVSKSTVKCTDYVSFPSSMFEDFAKNQYHELLSVLHLLGSDKWVMNENDTGL